MVNVTAPEALLELEAALKAVAEDADANKLSHYLPYPKQMEFHAAGVWAQERLLVAGNRLGKSFSGSFEVAAHLTGDYPDWWPGRTWDRPTRVWVAGASTIAVRDTTQKLLIGDLTAGVHNIGTGAIPKDRIVGYTLHRGVADGIDTVQIKHKSGGISLLKFKSYEQDRGKWMGDSIDVLWADEEPPEDLYAEGCARFGETGGMSMMTFTPLKGMSNVVKRFFHEQNPYRFKITMTMDDAGHMTPELRERALSKYLEHERECRANGVPMAGEGRVFNVAESVIVCEPFDIPQHWVHGIGFDHGVSHPTAACWMAWDRDSDTLYTYATYRQKNEKIATHAAALKSRGRIPIIWPHDVHKRDAESGKSIAKIYRDTPHNCFMLPSHVTFPDGSTSFEAGIADMMERMTTGRWRVFKSCTDWIEEYRSYHREDGEVVKIDDDLISASRYGSMGRRFFKSVDRNWYPGRKGPSQGSIAPGVNFDVFKG